MLSYIKKTLSNEFEKMLVCMHACVYACMCVCNVCIDRCLTMFMMYVCRV